MRSSIIAILFYEHFRRAITFSHKMSLTSVIYPPIHSKVCKFYCGLIFYRSTFSYYIFMSEYDDMELQ